MKEMIWLTVSTAAELLGKTERCIRLNCKNGIYSSRIMKTGRRERYEIDLNSLAAKYQKRYLKKYLPFETEKRDPETDAAAYCDAPDYNKLKAEKYTTLFNITKGMQGKALEKFLDEWNKKNPDMKTSYRGYIRNFKKFREQGMAGLVGKWGKSVGLSKVTDEMNRFFQEFYLKEGAPSAPSCRELVYGRMQMKYGNIEKKDFPSYQAFLRRLKNTVPAQAVFYARYGSQKWNRKFANHTSRDYSGLIAGKVWVSDHHQADVPVITKEDKITFPWITGWRDMKTGKWLSWKEKCGSPNSDDIFETFQRAVGEFGIPDAILIDNGKDYRCNDFAGGRKFVKIAVDEQKTRTLLSSLDVEVHFAEPYNAQAKPIERDFHSIVEMFWKHLPAYRGVNTANRPESSDKMMKDRTILQFDEFCLLFDDFILNAFNKRIVNGKVCMGRSPDEVFYAEFTEKKMISKDALKLFCTRTKHDLTIMRNGIRDSELGLNYFAEWMLGVKGTKVYVRRDVKAYQEAWVFNADNDEYLGKAFIADEVPVIAKTPVEKEKLKAAVKRRKQEKKIIAGYLPEITHSPKDTLDFLKASLAANMKKEVKKEIVTNLYSTDMDKIIDEEKHREELGTYDISALVPVEEKTDNDEIKLWEFEKLS